MRITVFGATGNVGSRVVAEASSRGHEVTAVVRRPPPPAAFPADVAIRIGDIGSLDDAVAASTDQDVVIAATRPPAGQEPDLIATTRTLVTALTGSSVRLLVVGGAGGLIVPGTDGRTVLVPGTSMVATHSQ